MSTLSQEEAQHSLVEIQETIARMKKSLAAGNTGLYLILWGMIWIVGFLFTQFHPSRSGWAWLILDSIGILASIGIGLVGGVTHPKVKRPDSRRMFWRIFFCWFFCFLYLDLWMVVLWPVKYEQAITFLCTGIMFAYVMFGLFFERFMLWLGLTVTGLIILGYFLFLSQIFPWFWIWMAVAGGGTLAGTGIYIHFRWK